MSIIKVWISAFRLRTLPLATAAVLAGSSIADLHHSLDIKISILCFTTAVALQILSNLANDYGDFTKGTDNEKRLGNMRALQSGSITQKQMLLMIIVFIGICLWSGISLLYQAVDGNINTQFVLFFLIGIVSIIAAIKYTVGKNAYGYSGLGDIAVFAFFGPVAVIGTFLLNTHFEFNTQNDLLVLLPASGIGLLCTAVLNTNNIRDVENDNTSGKHTIPVKIGLLNARVYHTFLIVGGVFCTLVYSFSNPFHWIKLLQIPAAFLIIKNLIDVRKTEPSPKFNLFLKELSLGILLFVLFFVFTNAASTIFLSTEAIIKVMK